MILGLICGTVILGMVNECKEPFTGKLSFNLEAKIKLTRERVESKMPLSEMLMQKTRELGTSGACREN